ncbi:MAG: glycosyl transferase [Xanthobacteraceae bacterium]|nr:MAG: glycosyl transferase [Xanthobacteraceae bacterium]
MTEGYGQHRWDDTARPTHRINPGRGLVSVLDVASVSHWRAVLLLTIAALIFFLPGFFAIPPLDREESDIAQITKQMIENDNYVDLRFQNQNRQSESVASHWLQAAAVHAVAATGLPRTSVRIFPYRMPSLIGGIGAVLATYWAALAFAGRRGAVLAGLMLCASILLGIEARLARPDAMMLLMVTAALGAMARAYFEWQRGDERTPARGSVASVFWLALTGGLVIGGPLMLMYVVLPVAVLAVLDRSVTWVRRLYPALGMLWLVIVTATWALAILVQGGGLGLMLGTLGGDVWSRMALLPMFQGGPPGTQFVMFFALFWPGAALAGLAAPAVWRARHQPGAQFLLAWLVPAWLVAELLLPKLPHLVLPLLPAVAIMIAGTVERQALAEGTWVSRGAMWWFVVPAVISVAAVVASIVFTRQPAFAAWPFAAGAMIFGLVAWGLYDLSRAERSLLNAIAASLLIGITVFGILMPTLTPLFPSVELSRALRNMKCDKPMAAAVGYQEPSLVFMSGTSTLLTDASGAADFLQQGQCRFALVEGRYERAFAQRAEAIGLLYAVTARVEGYNYIHGRQISVAIFSSDGTE